MASHHQNILPLYLEKPKVMEPMAKQERSFISYITDLYYDEKKTYKSKSKPVDPELGLTHAEINGYVIVNVKH